MKWPRACVLPRGGATSADHIWRWGGTRAWRGGVCGPARRRSVRSRRVCVRCVFACGHSSRHQPLSRTWGSELLPLLFGFGAPSFLPLRPSPSARAPARAPDSQAEVRRARRASPRSRFPRLPPPPCPVRSAHSASTPLELAPLRLGLPRPLGLPGLRGVCPCAFLRCPGLNCHRSLRSPSRPRLAGGRRRPPPAPHRGLPALEGTWAAVTAHPPGLGQGPLSLLAVLRPPSFLSCSSLARRHGVYFGGAFGRSPTLDIRSRCQVYIR